MQQFEKTTVDNIYARNLISNRQVKCFAYVSLKTKREPPQDYKTTFK